MRRYLINALKDKFVGTKKLIVKPKNTYNSAYLL